MSFKDHFSGHAAQYAAARPTYPAALFDWLAAQCPGRALAWDAGCGNGQASLALAERFERVFASDPSAEQIANALLHPRVRYAVEPAEACSLPAASADLIGVAQAYHWFDPARFAAEVRRVLRSGGLLAVFNYGLSRAGDEVDAVVRHLHDAVLGADWPPERRYAVEDFGLLPFPFPELTDVPPLVLHCDWTLAQYLAYLRSWSASRRYLRRTGADAVAETEPALAAAWGDPDLRRPVTWPLRLRAGRAP